MQEVVAATRAASPAPAAPSRGKPRPQPEVALASEAPPCDEAAAQGSAAEQLPPNSPRPAVAQPDRLQLLQERAQLLAERDELQREVASTRSRQEGYAKQSLELAERVSHKKRIIKGLSSEMDALKGQVRLFRERHIEITSRFVAQAVAHAESERLRAAFGRWIGYARGVACASTCSCAADAGGRAADASTEGIAPMPSDSHGTCPSPEVADGQHHSQSLAPAAAQSSRGFKAAGSAMAEDSDPAMEQEQSHRREVGPRSGAGTSAKARLPQPSPVFQRGPVHEKGQSLGRRAAVPGRRIAGRAAEPRMEGRPKGGECPEAPTVAQEPNRGPTIEEPSPEPDGAEEAPESSAGMGSSRASRELPGDQETAANAWLCGRGGGDEPPAPPWLFRDPRTSSEGTPDTMQKVQDLLGQRGAPRAISVETPGHILVWNDDPGQPHLLIVPKGTSRLTSPAASPRDV